MKKSNEKKLHLTTHKIRLLTAEQLHAIAGGVPTPMSDKPSCKNVSGI